MTTDATWKSRDRRANPLKTRTMLTYLTIASILGGFAMKGIDWLGNEGRSPAQRIQKLEVDHLSYGSKIDTLTDLTLMLVSMQCLGDSAKMESAKRAQVPCARVLRAQGIYP